MILKVYMICNVWKDKNYKVMCSKNIVLSNYTSDEVWYFYWGTETGKHMKRNSKSFIFFNLQNSGKRCCKDNVIDPKR